MTDADARIRSLFAEDVPPARDPAFSAAVMTDLARRRFIADIALLGAATVAGGFGLWAAWPHLAEVISLLSRGLAPVAAALALGAAALAVVDARLLPGLSRNHD